MQLTNEILADGVFEGEKPTRQIVNARKLAWASAGYLALMVTGLFLLHTKGWLDVGCAFLLLAAVSVVAVLMPLRQLGLLGAGGKASYSWKPIAMENRRYGRWLLGSAILYPLSNQVQTYLAAMLGLRAPRVLRAMQIPAQVMTQIITATALLMLPPMTQEFGEGRTGKLREMAVLCTPVLTAIALGYFATLEIFAKPAGHIFYGGKFAAYAGLIPILALFPLFPTFGTGFSRGLRAAQKPQYDLIANAVAAPLGILTALAFIRLWGVRGAALSLAASAAVVGAVLFWMFFWSQKRGG